jgi:hypothetical protein
VDGLAVQLMVVGTPRRKITLAKNPLSYQWLYDIPVNLRKVKTFQQRETTS